MTTALAGGYDIVASLRSSAADAPARDEARRVVERRNRALVASRDIWWSPTIRAALVAGTPWLVRVRPRALKTGTTAAAWDMNTGRTHKHPPNSLPSGYHQHLLPPRSAHHTRVHSYTPSSPRCRVDMSSG
jgi:hypothetical protein